jgi:hypothetical protein
VLFFVFSKTKYIEIEINRLLPNLYLFIVSNCLLRSFLAIHTFVTLSKTTLKSNFCALGHGDLPLSLSLSPPDLMLFPFQSVDLMSLEAIPPLGLIFYSKNCEVTVQLLTLLLRFVLSPHSNLDQENDCPEV